MPNITIFHAGEQALDEAGFNAMASDMEAEIINILKALPETIQIMPVLLAHPPLGREVHVDIRARANDHRSGEVVESFLNRIDEITFKRFGTRCRIRYFSYTPEQLAARN